MAGGGGLIDGLVGSLAHPSGQGRGCGLMAVSGDGHVLGGGVDEVEGCLVCSFGQSGRHGVVVAAG